MSESNDAPATCLRIQDLTLDLGRHCLKRGGREIPLPKLSFKLLQALAETAPDTLTTDELIDRVWRGTVVSPATVSKRVELLRQSLGDDSHAPRYIAVVRGHGYRLIPDVEKVVATTAKRTGRRRPHWVLVMAATVVAVIVGAYLLRTPTTPPDQSIAVLPFTARPASPDDQGLADGLAIEVGSILARAGMGKVVGGKLQGGIDANPDGNLAELGETLGVAHILDGRLQRSADNILVEAHLRRATDGAELWAGAYDRGLAQLSEIQHDIARQVIATLRIDAEISAVTLSVPAQDTNAEAYALYLKALSLSPWRKGQGLAEAQAIIEQVTGMDPGFASGWNRLAAIHGRRLFARDPAYPHSPPESMRIMRSAVARALAINPDSAEAYANLAGIAWAFEQDSAKAAPLLERALRLDPSNLEIVQFAIDFTSFLGRFEQAIALSEQLVARDPLCRVCRLQLGSWYLFTMRLDEAEDQFRTLQVVEDGGLHWNLGVVLLLQGRPGAALDSFEQIQESDLLRLQGRALAYFALDRSNDANATLERLAREWGAAQPIELAQAYAYTGRLDAAFDTLQRALPEHGQLLQFVYPNPLFHRLHADRRWGELLERINRAPHQVQAVTFSLPGAGSTD